MGEERVSMMSKRISCRQGEVNGCLLGKPWLKQAAAVAGSGQLGALASWCQVPLLRLAVLIAGAGWWGGADILVSFALNYVGCWCLC